MVEETIKIILKESLGVMMHSCNYSSQESKAGLLQVQGQTGLSSKF